jgi:SAM-dependent methyltransferase
MVPWELTAASTGGQFTRAGRNYLDAFVQVGLRPNHRVLDIGCGLGRMAVPLTNVLTSGSYEGLDVTKHAIKWCSRRITPRYPNFRFHHVDIYNDHYNPSGRLTLREFRLPYAEAEFDFVYLISVFTHLPPDEVRHYLMEIARVLKPEGTCFATFFLLTPDAIARVDKGAAHREFPHVFEGYRTMERDELGTAIAFDEIFVRDLYREAGLDIVDPIRLGWWSGISADLFQDVVVARKDQRAYEELKEEPRSSSVSLG